MSNGRPKKTIAGRLSVLRELGSGAVGQVFLAEDEGKNLVAVKLLDEALTEKGAERVVDRFKSEFSILRELSHPGINRVFDFGFDSEWGRYFFTAEYVSGLGFLDATRETSVDQIEELFVQVLRALEYLHSHGIMHCDIKSGNVLVQRKDDGSPQVKLIDFGLAALGSPDRIMGTPSYIAPEIILKNKPDSRADLYSLGVLIYTAIAKFNPFRAGEMTEAFSRQLNLRPEPPSIYNPDTKPYLDEILLKLLAKSPSERFPTAAHVIRAINFGGGKAYPVETKETFLGYLPTEGNLVGRRGELEAIKKQCLAVKDGEVDSPFVLCVEGEAGTGRKRLLTELKYFAQLNEMEVVELKATDKGSLDEFNARLDSLMADLKGPAVVGCYVLGLLAVDKAAARTMSELAALIKRIRFCRAMADIRAVPKIMFAFTADPEELPLLMHFLDLHEECGGGPMWPPRRAATTPPPRREINLIKLTNFNEQETGKYLTALTGVEDVPEKLTSELFNRTQGNPLFLTELTKALVEGGMLYDKFGRWNREVIEDIGVNFDQLKVPTSLMGVLDKAYEGALPKEKRVMEAMAVWHRPVTFSELNSVTKLTDLGRVLTQLALAGVVGFDPTAALYSFGSALLREVVYSKMKGQDRISLHEGITRYLTRVRPGQFVEINWHKGRGSDAHAAIDALITLGVYYLKNTQPFDAISILTEAQNRLKGEAYRRDEIRLHLGEACVLARRYEEAVEIYDRLLIQQEGADSPIADKIVTCQKLGIVYLRKGDIPKAKMVLGRAADYLQTVPGQDVVRLKTMNLLARSEFLEGRIDDAIRLYRETKAKWGELPDEDKKEVLNNDLAHAYLQNGQLDLAEKEFDADIEFFEGVGAENELERSYYSLAELSREKGELDRAVEYFERAIEIAKKLTDSEILLRAYNGLGNVFSGKGDTGKGLYWYDRGLDLAVRTGEDSTAAAIAVNIGLIEAGQRNLDQAEGHLKSAVNIFDQARRKTPLDMGYVLRAYVELAGIYRLKKEFGKAEYYLKESEELVDSVPGLSGHLFQIRKIEVELARDRGEWISVRRLLPRLREVAEGEGQMEALGRLEGEIRLGAEEATVGEEWAEERPEKISTILDVSAKKGEGGTMTTKHYRYILEINKYLSGEADLDFVLKTILKYALELSGAEAGLILLVGDDGELDIRCKTNIEVDENLSEVSVGIAKSAIGRDEVVLTADATADKEFKAMESVMLLGLRSVMCIPIHARKRVIGVLYIENRSKPAAFAEADTEVLAAFADQAGIAIENARLIAQHQASEKRLRQELSESSVQLERLNTQIKTQVSDLARRYQFDKITSVSPKMESVFAMLEKICVTELTVCIIGESGTGKELVAKAIHYNSGRRKGPFVPVNCGAIPATLMESELFGYKAGAFTGAIRDKVGLFESAIGGTIFLDEIAELDISLQAKLLRVIQEREVLRVGDTKPVKCDLRILCATNKNLENLVGEKELREDLYFRIAEIKVDLPPLRERTEDIPLLIDEFVSEYCAQHKIKKRPEVDKDFVYACISYGWPGNIRELENTVRVATALAASGKINVACLPDNHVLKKYGRQAHTRPLSPKPSAHTGGADLPLIDNINRYDPAKTWKEYEAEIIAAAYKFNRFDARETGKNLDIALTTVYKKVGELGLKDQVNPLFDTPFKYEVGISLQDYVTRVFKAAWECAGKHPYQAIKALGVSQGYFYKVMKRF